MKKNYFLALALVAFMLGCAPQQSSDEIQATQAPQPKIKNVIFMVGDGMGVTQVYAGFTKNKGKLNLERIKHIGFSRTYSFDDYITDSAAGATAFSVGMKTYNGAIGVSPDTIPQETILEKAIAKGLSTGVVVTSAITHATPAAFMAHQPSREMYEQIAGDIAKANVDVLIGGGVDNFNKRADSLNLLDTMKAQGYAFAGTIDEVVASTSPKLLGLLYPFHAPKMSEGRGEMLAKGVAKTIDILSKNEKGFFMVVEGSQIDWGGHQNDAEYVALEVVDFDNTIGVVLDWAEKNGETLVVITADHETGGLALTGGDIAKGEVKGEFITTHHSGVMVPVFAFGPGAEEFMGMYENIALNAKMRTALGIE